MVEFGRGRPGVAAIDRLGVAAAIDKGNDEFLPFALTNFVGNDNCCRVFHAESIPDRHQPETVASSELVEMSNAWTASVVSGRARW